MKNKNPITTTKATRLGDEGQTGRCATDGNEIAESVEGLSMSLNIKDNRDKVRSKPAKAVNFEDVAIDLQKARTQSGPATDVRWDDKLSRFVMVYGQAT